MGFSVLSVGSPSAEKDGFSLFTNTSEWQLGRLTNIKIQREMQELLTGRCLQPTQRSVGLFLHMHWLADWQARWRWRQTESWHMHTILTEIHFVQLCTCTHMDFTRPHSNTSRLHSCHTLVEARECRHVDVYASRYLIQQGFQMTCSPLQTGSISFPACTTLTKWPWCLKSNKSKTNTCQWWWWLLKIFFFVLLWYTFQKSWHFLLKSIKI